MPTYFHSVQEFNALNYLWQTVSSPMILIALGAWAMVSLLPKLTVSDGTLNETHARRD